jgi:hypothetical protein
MPGPGLKINTAALVGLTPVELDAINAELKLVEAAYKQNPLLGYRPHPKQLSFHTPPHPPLRAFFGGNRSGKTTATMVDTIIQAVDGEMVPDHLLPFKRWEPPFYCRVVTPDLTNTLEGVVLQKFRDWCPRGQLHGGGFERAWDKMLRMLRFKNGSWIQFFSNDQDVDKFGGAALHRIVYDEEPREDIRRECLMRLIDFGGEELYGMTPLNGMSWTFDEIYEPWERGELQDGRVLVVDMDDNPHLDRETMRRVLAGLSSEEREARKSGRFVHFAGLVFPQFSKARHVVPSISEIPAGVELFCGIDPGVRHMCAVVFAYLDMDDRMVIFDEIALQGKTVKEVCEEIHRTNTKWNIRPKWYVIDPSAKNRNSQTGRSDQAEFSDHGVVTIPGQNSISAGINRLKERLDADRLVVAANCVELRGEFKRYRWASQRRSENDPKEAPVKKDDHLLDALRYMVMQRPLTPEEERKPQTLTMKDRLLRESLRRLRGGPGRVPDNHFFGPGQFV